MVDTVELPGSYAYELVALCARWNVDPGSVLDGTGLTAQALKDPATRLSLPTCAALVARARQLIGQPPPMKSLRSFGPQ